MKQDLKTTQNLITRSNPSKARERYFTHKIPDIFHFASPFRISTPVQQVANKKKEEKREREREIARRPVNSTARSWQPTFHINIRSREISYNRWDIVLKMDTRWGVSRDPSFLGKMPGRNGYVISQTICQFDASSSRGVSLPLSTLARKSSRLLLPSLFSLSPLLLDSPPLVQARLPLLLTRAVSRLKDLFAL